MNFYGLTVAMMLPWLLGFVWVRVLYTIRPMRIIKKCSATNATVITQLGYGYVVGMFSITVIMRTLDAADFRQNFIWLVFIVLAFTFTGYFLLHVLESRKNEVVEHPWTNEKSSPFGNALFVSIFILIVIHLMAVFIEIWNQPLYSWDAWMNWAPKARVWLEHGWLVRYVSPNDWMRDSVTDTAYTLGNAAAWRYPPTVPLIQLWTALGLGMWDDSLVNLPWFFCLVSLGLGFYGQTRRIGFQPVIALLLVYLLFSMPYIGVHAALAGYADLWLATVYGLAAMALVHWINSKDIRQGMLALFLAIACTQIKLPGIVWAMTFIPAIFIAMTTFRWMYMVGIMLVLALMFMALLFWGGIEVVVPGGEELVLTMDRVAIPGFRDLKVQYHPVWEAFLKNDFVFSNWHLFWYLWWPTIVPLVILKPWSKPKVAILALVGTAISFVFWIFFFTGYYKEAINYTTINRATIHMVPMLLFSATAVAAGLFNRSLPKSRSEL